jgi:kynurenine formamidase
MADVVLNIVFIKIIMILVITYLLEFKHFQMFAGVGTHIDSPAHCFPNAASIDQLSLQQFLAPCVMIDVSSLAHESYICQVDDILNFERIHGQIQKDTLVVVLQVGVDIGRNHKSIEMI